MAETTRYPVADAFIEEDEHWEKRGTWDYLAVAPDPGYRCRSLLFFDVTSFLPGTTINSAKLYLYYHLRASSAGIGRTHNLHRILQNWAESSVTWDNQPSRDSVISASKVIPEAYGWLDWDVKSDLEKFIAGTQENKGWLLKDKTEETVEAADVAYRSREFVSLKPYLLIDYTPPPPVQVNLSDTLAMTAAVTDTWKYQGLAKRISDSLSMSDRPVFKLNDNILIFLRDQVTISDHIGAVVPGGGTIIPDQTDDAFVWEEEPATNYGSETYLQFWDQEDAETQNLLLFDLSEVDPEIDIITAKLWLYFYGDMELWGDDIPMDVFRATSSWNQASVTWNNKPTIAGVKTSTTDLIDDQPGWYAWDVKADVEAFLAETYTNYGWLLKVPGLTGNLDQRAYSKDTAQSQKPYLEIIWGGPAHYYRSIKDKLLINDILSKADMIGWYYRGLGDNLAPIGDSLSYRRIPRTLLTDLDLSPAQIVRQEFPVSEIIPKDEILTVYIETADGQKWKHKLHPI